MPKLMIVGLKANWDLLRAPWMDGSKHSRSIMKCRRREEIMPNVRELTEKREGRIVLKGFTHLIYEHRNPCATPPAKKEYEDWFQSEFRSRFYIADSCGSMGHDNVHDDMNMYVIMNDHSWAMNTKLKNKNRLVPFQLIPKLFTWGRVETELADCSSSIQC